MLWVAACDAVPPLAGEPDVCALVLVGEEVVEEAVEEEEPDVAAAVVAAGMPAFVVVVVTTCGASRTSATVPANGRLSIASISNLTCDRAVRRRPLLRALARAAAYDGDRRW